jgi:cytochrome b
MPGDRPGRAIIWDLPIRLFHWAIVAAIAASWWTSEQEDSETHALIGYTVIALLLFRFAWGFVGSETARFGSFVRPPSEALEHIRHLLRPGKLDRHVGHNALGGYSVLLLLASLSVQVVTGLFLYDDEYFWAPLNAWVSEDMADLLEDVHEANFNLLLVLIGLHVAAILFYGFVKGLDLVRPMLSGRAELPAGSAPQLAPLWLAAVLAAGAGLLVWYLLASG